LILAGEGDTDAAALVLGLLVGSAVANNFLIASCQLGVEKWAPAAVITGWVFCVTIGFLMRTKT
jgi:hypothetical protein